MNRGIKGQFMVRFYTTVVIGKQVNHKIILLPIFIYRWFSHTWIFDSLLYLEYKICKDFYYLNEGYIEKFIRLTSYAALKMSDMINWANTCNAIASFFFLHIGNHWIHVQKFIVILNLTRRFIQNVIVHSNYKRKLGE